MILRAEGLCERYEAAANERHRNPNRVIALRRLSQTMEETLSRLRALAKKSKGRAVARPR
jgi:hypothetical protein